MFTNWTTKLLHCITGKILDFKNLKTLFLKLKFKTNFHTPTLSSRALIRFSCSSTLSLSCLTVSTNSWKSSNIQKIIIGQKSSWRGVWSRVMSTGSLPLSGETVITKFCLRICSDVHSVRSPSLVSTHSIRKFHVPGKFPCGKHMKSNYLLSLLHTVFVFF